MDIQKKHKIVKEVASDYKKDIEIYKEHLKNGGKLVTDKTTLKMFKNRGLINDFCERTGQIDIFRGTAQMLMLINNKYYIIHYVDGSFNPYLYRLDNKIVSNYLNYYEQLNYELEQNNIMLYNIPYKTEKETKKVIEFCKS